MTLVLSSTTYILLASTFVALILILIDYSRPRTKKPATILDCENFDLPDPPGPKPWPIIGSLHLLGQHDVPYKAFANLVKVFKSEVIKLRMGSVQCVVVNGLQNIKEVVIQKGDHFDSRPNFVRYHRLFSGNKENCEHPFPTSSIKIVDFVFNFYVMCDFDKYLV